MVNVMSGTRIETQEIYIGSKKANRESELDTMTLPFVMHHA